MTDERVTQILPSAGVPGEIVWRLCPDCGGQIGATTAYLGQNVCCPGCGSKVFLEADLKPGILFRPPARPSVTPAGYESSLKLRKAADTCLGWGLASIALGWTVFIPLVSLFVFLNTCDIAKAEKTPVPTKAWWGLGLTLIFGAIEIINMIAYMNRH